jgi:hypothetical protein
MKFREAAFPAYPKTNLIVYFPIYNLTRKDTP